jgi:imidazolonepropionase
LLSLRQAMQLACTHFKLTPEEALRGATVHAARALGLHDRGALRVGMRADLVHWNVQRPAELCYWLDGELARTVFVPATQCRIDRNRSSPCASDRSSPCSPSR